MYTYDEWGNYVFHITTGRKGMELLTQAGLKNTITDEEYSKHMTSYRKLKQEENERFMKEFEKLFKP